MDNIENNENNLSDEEIEIKPKSYNRKKPYEFTEARKKQFEIAKLKRNENIDSRKVIKNKINENNNMVLQTKILQKAETIKKKTERQLKVIDNIPEPVIIKKKNQKYIIKKLIATNKTNKIR